MPMDPPRSRRVPLVLCLLAVVGCSAGEQSPEAGIRAWLRAAETAAEDRDRGAVLDLVSEAYSDARGNDKEAIGNLLRAYFFRQQSVNLLTRVEAIRLEGASAAEVLLFVGMAGAADTALGLRADAWNLELELVNDGDDWQLIGARWGEVGGELR